MSRADGGGDADGLRVPDAPRIGGAFTAAFGDFYFNSWRLLPANLAWGVVFIVVVLALSNLGVVGVAATVLLGPTLAGVYRLAALITREDAVALSDAVAAWRRYALPSAAMVGVLALVAVALVTNVVVGALAGDVIGWSFATLAFWGLFGTWCYAQIFWPLLVDPRREAEPIASRARTAALLLVAFPGRFATLALLVLVILALSTVLFAPLLTVSVAYVALVGARYVLPAADRLEGRATVRVLA